MIVEFPYPAEQVPHHDLQAHLRRHDTFASFPLSFTERTPQRVRRPAPAKTFTKHERDAQEWRRPDFTHKTYQRYPSALKRCMARIHKIMAKDNPHRWVLGIGKGTHARISSVYELLR
jgi:hypothetical protein